MDIEFTVPKIGMPGRLFYLRSANMNITTDQIFTKDGSFSTFIVTSIRAYRGSTNLTTVQGGIYGATSKGAPAVVASTQAYTLISNGTTGVNLTVSTTGNGIISASDLYLSLTIAQGSAATADFEVFGMAVS